MTRLWRMASKGRETLGRFARDTRGNIAILFGITLIPLIGMIGLAVDGGRAYSAAEAAHKAADAAALAAAKAMAEQNLGSDEVARVAQKYFDANVRGALSDASFGPLDVQADFARNSVTVAVDARVPTTFAGIFNVEQISVRRSSTVAAGLNDIDLALMLDVTGSMNQRGKLRAMKNATADLIDMIVPEGRKANRVRIALAPYSGQVNVGRFARRVSDDPDLGDCVAERGSTHRNTDAPPLRNARFHALTPDEADNYERQSRRRQQPSCPPAVIEPLSSDGTRLKRIVKNYRADGYTAGHLGIQWAWNLISPGWGGVWPGGSAPQPYNKKGVIKAVVLMTDGEFNTAYTAGLSEGAMKRESYRHTRQLCDNIKAEKVIVFSVAFDLDDADARRALKDCSSGDGFFHRAENETELRMAYRDIAIKLTELRIAK